MANLSRLQKVDLREVWADEAGDFTPWLAHEENLRLLGETVGLELELEGEEQGVWPFRADILCRDTAANRYVLIENQLERTDHNHLGQLMTYAAGLDAVVVVWVAAQFTDEHRAALDWLNEVTSEDLSFFGLEVELWRIGESDIAPKFNIVSKPNEWTKGGGPAGTHGRELTDFRKMQLEYWTQFRTCMELRDSDVSPRVPKPSGNLSAGIGRTGFSLRAFMNTFETRIGVSLIIEGRNGHAHFHLLHAERSDIEEGLGYEAEWQEMPDQRRSRVTVYREADATDQDDWVAQHGWLRERLEEFSRVFRERVRVVDAGEYVHEDGDGDE